MSIYQSSLDALKKNVSVTTMAKEKAVEFDISRLKPFQEHLWMQFVKVFYESIELTTGIFRDFIVLGGGQFTETLIFFLRDDKKCNDTMVCSWFHVLNGLSFGNEPEKQACVDFLKTRNVDLCRQLLNCNLIDAKSNLLTFCQL